MATKRKQAEQIEQQPIEQQLSKIPVLLGELLSKSKESLVPFRTWLVGDTPLITHAWSLKAKMEMLKKQAGAIQLAKEKRDPEQDFLESLYAMGKDDKGQETYGFPVTAFKKAIWTNANVKRGIAKTDLMAALWIDAELVQTRPALKGARCDMPMVRIWGSPPEMREDMVRIGSGVRKTANFAYRGQFTTWAVRMTGALNEDIVQVHQLVFLIRQAGRATGVGDWRNEKLGWFGGFHIGDLKEEEAWNLFAAGKGPLPQPQRQEAPSLSQHATRRNGKKEVA